MCLVTKGEKLLVEKDITLEDFITIKVTPVRIHHLVPGRAEEEIGGSGRGRGRGRGLLLALASTLKGRRNGMDAGRWI